MYQNVTEKQPRNRPKNKVNRSLTKDEDNSMEKLVFFQEMMLEQLDIHMQKMILDANPTDLQKVSQTRS